MIRNIILLSGVSIINPLNLIFAHQELKFNQLNEEQQIIHKELYKNSLEGYKTEYKKLLKQDDEDTQEEKSKLLKRNFLSACLLLKYGKDIRINYIKPKKNENYFMSGDSDVLRQKVMNILEYPATDLAPKMEDTEMKLIVQLLEMNLENDKEVTEVELHIFSTRDMCPNCYNAMELFLKTTNEESFFNKFPNAKPKIFVSSIARNTGEDDKRSKYSFSANPNTEQNNLFCIFLRNDKNLYISNESVLAKTCQERLDLDFCKNLPGYLLYPEYHTYIYKREYRGNKSIDLQLKDLEKVKTQDRNQERNEKEKRNKVFPSMEDNLSVEDD